MHLYPEESLQNLQNLQSLHLPEELQMQVLLPEGYQHFSILTHLFQVHLQETDTRQRLLRLLQSEKHFSLRSQ